MYFSVTDCEDESVEAESNPIASCLQITPKRQSTKTGSTTPRRTSSEIDDLRQTPFRLSPQPTQCPKQKYNYGETFFGSPRQHKHQTYRKFYKHEKKSESDLIKTTIEGVFEVNSKSRCSFI